MKWYHIKFSDADLSANNDEKFVSQFVKLLHTLRHPDKLGLYSLNFQMEEGLAYLTQNEAGGYFYSGEVAHFTTWNTDKIED